MIKNIFAGIKSYIKRRKIFFIVLFLLLLASMVWGPLGVPMRCHTSYYGQAPGFGACPGIPPAPGSPNMTIDCPTVGGGQTTECFSIFHKEFWQHPEWELGFNSIFPSVNYVAPLISKITGSSLIRGIHFLYPADYANDAVLMGASHNVFVGKVVTQVGNKDFVNNPATQFSVEVISNIKGDLKDTVVVNQSGGYKDGVLYLAEENAVLLKPGATYLFATRYDAENDYYTLNPHPNASKLLISDGAESDADLKTLADKDEKVKALEAAYPDEQLLDADVGHNNTRNEFKSLPEEKKTEVKALADSAKASLNANDKTPQ